MGFRGKSNLQVQNILNEFEIPLAEDYTESGFGIWAYEVGPNAAIEIPELGKVSVIKAHTGSGGYDGEETYIVFKIVDEQGFEHLYKKEGWYASFSGTSWDGAFFEVNEKVVTRTEYTRIHG